MFFSIDFTYIVALWLPETALSTSAYLGLLHAALHGFFFYLFFFNSIYPSGFGTFTWFLANYNIKLVTYQTGAI